MGSVDCLLRAPRPDDEAVPEAVALRLQRDSAPGCRLHTCHRRIYAVTPALWCKHVTSRFAECQTVNNIISPSFVSGELTARMRHAHTHTHTLSLSLSLSLSNAVVTTTTRLRLGRPNDFHATLIRLTGSRTEVAWRSHCSRFAS